MCCRRVLRVHGGVMAAKVEGRGCWWWEEWEEDMLRG